MSLLEDKIEKNRGFFDDAEPSAGHLERFSARLEKQATARRRILYRRVKLSVAAAILLLAGLSFVALYLLKQQPSQQQVRVTQIKFSGELDEVLQYYNAEANQKIAKIDRLALSPEEAETIHKQADRQLEELDARLVEIEKEYMKNPGNEQLKAALVNTQRKKAEVAGLIVRQMEMARSGVRALNTTTIQF